MKIKILAAALSCIGIASTASAQILFGPDFGYTRSTMMQTINGNAYNNEWVSGGKVGVLMDIPVGDRFSFQPGAAFNFMHGGISTYSAYHSVATGMPGQYKDYRKYQLYTISVPLMFTLKSSFNYSPNMMTFSVGPYVNYNFGGLYNREDVTTLNGTPRPVYYDRELSIGGRQTRDDIRPVEVGAMVSAGYMMKNGLYFRAHYGIGLNDMAPGVTGDNNYRSHGWGISVAYLFGQQRDY